MARPRRRLAAARRALWRLWPDRNPLRRRADRIERLVIIGLLALFAAAAPVAALTVGHAATAGAARAVARAEAAAWHRVPAHLVQSAPPPRGPADPSTYLARVPAWWIGPDQARRNGQVLVPAGTQAGHLVQVWIDRAGRLVPGPLGSAQAAGNAVLAAVGTVAVLAAALVIGGAVARRVLDRRRMAAWEAAWSSVGPEWTGHH
jgi:hypothetical protein